MILKKSEKKINLVSNVDLVKNLLEDLNHSMPETFDVGEFKGNFVNSFKFLTIIIVPNISSSI